MYVYDVSDKRLSKWSWILQKKDSEPGNICSKFAYFGKGIWCFNRIENYIKEKYFDRRCVREGYLAYFHHSSCFYTSVNKFH